MLKIYLDSRSISTWKLGTKYVEMSLWSEVSLSASVFCLEVLADHFFFNDKVSDDATFSPHNDKRLLFC